MSLPSTTLLGVRVNSVSQEQILHYITKNPKQPLTIFTPNPEIITYAFYNKTYRTIINQADIALPDGQGVVWGSKGAIPERVTGVDTMLHVLKWANIQHLSIGIVLNKQGLSSKDEVVLAFQKKFPNCPVYCTYTNFGWEVPDIILVALGFPFQEEWVVKHKSKLQSAKILMTVGAGIDFITGKQSRAPLFFRKIRLEWLWRLIKQPRRWKRILTATIVFPWLVLTQQSKFTQHDNS